MSGALFFLVLLSSCMTNNTLDTSSMATENVSNLSRVSPGMSHSQVLQIMGPPFRKKTLHIDKDIYDIWFYVTRTTTLDQSRMSPTNLTPLVLKNGVLVGWGWDLYSQVLNRQKQPKAVPPSSATKPTQQEEDEDKGLEKALEMPSASSPAAPVQSTPSLSSQAKPPAKQAPPEEEEEEEDSKEKVPLDEEDERMLQEESEQEFDFW